AALAAIVAPGDKVCVEGGRGLEGPAAGAAANALWHADLYGDFQTGYSSFFRPPPSGPAEQLCRWHLLPAHTPAPPVIADPHPVWEGLGWRLLQRNPAVTLALDLANLDEAPHIDRTTGPGGSARLPITAWRPDGGPDITTWSPPLMGVLTPMWGARWRWMALTDSGISLHVEREGLTIAPALPLPIYPTANSDAQTLQVVVDSETPDALIDISTATGIHGVRVPSGVAIVNAGSIRRGETITLRLMAAYLVEKPSEGIGAAPLPQTLPLAIDSSMTDGRLELSLNGPTAGAEAVLDIYREDGAVHYGYWQLGTSGLPGGVTLDLAGQTLTTMAGGQLPHQVFPVEDGRYRGMLLLYRNGAPERSQTLFSFQLRGGVASDFVMETRGDRIW
ncbi:MAG: hypothetical protein NTZ05_00620, partial [Chloroflexi bacterium]|nr:hypothetical protein [Chloroflexota bacterium]